MPNFSCMETANLTIAKVYDGHMLYTVAMVKLATNGFYGEL